MIYSCFKSFDCGLRIVDCLCLKMTEAIDAAGKAGNLFSADTCIFAQIVSSLCLVGIEPIESWQIAGNERLTRDAIDDRPLRFIIQH
jgi:hypothetical protein